MAIFYDIILTLFTFLFNMRNVRSVCDGENLARVHTMGIFSLSLRIRWPRNVKLKNRCEIQKERMRELCIQKKIKYYIYITRSQWTSFEMDFKYICVQIDNFRLIRAVFLSLGSTAYGEREGAKGNVNANM